MVNDFEFIHKFLPTPTYILDLQIVTKRLQFPKDGLKDVVQKLFRVEVKKEFQRFDWHKRPLPYKARLYARDDARWVQRIFEELKQEIREEDFLTTNDLWMKNVFKPHVFRGSDFGMGKFPVEAASIFRFLWEKREEWGKRENVNTGLILSKKDFSRAAEKMYEEWVVHKNQEFIFKLARGQGYVHWKEYHSFCTP